MAALGCGVKDVTDMSISIGTVLACVNLTEKYIPTKDVCISPWINGKYCQLVFDGNGATSLEWYQKNFANKYTLAELVKMAEQIDSRQGLTARPRAFQYQSIEDAFSGIKNHHSHGHFIYALMKSSAKTLESLISGLSPDKKPSKIFATGGGAKSQLWLKIISDIADNIVIASDNKEPATVGAVIIK